MSNETRSQLLTQIADRAGLDATTIDGRCAAREILANLLVNEMGIEINRAFDLVWGENAYEKAKAQVADQIWEEVNA